MKYTDNNYLYSDITNKILSAAHRVYHKLGAGFVEKVYENALTIELKRMELTFNQQYPIKVYYEGIIVGEYIADLIIEEKVIVELKAVNQLNRSHEVQLVNYLKATGIPVGLLLNFGDRLDIKRRVHNAGK